MSTKLKCHRTGDRGRFFTVNDLGAKRSITPEGFLVCHDVPIARTGTQLYHKDELRGEDGKPLIEPGPDGLIRIDRLPEEVFRDETLLSFEGKAVTVEHPNDFVTPETWKKVSVGTVQNVRRGTGIQDDLLIADLVITDQAAIAYVNKELPEVSAGYEAAYEQSEPGRGFQREIVGNHVALVERGRAGPRCSIQDKEITTMPTAKKRSVWDRLMAAVKAKDAEAIAEELKDVNDSEEDDQDEDGKKKTGDTAAILKAIDAQSKLIAKLSKDVDELKKKSEDGEEEDDEDEKKKSKDSDDEDENETMDTVLEAEETKKKGDPLGKVLSGDSLKLVGPRAELLVPGTKFKVKDKASERAEALDFMRDTLQKALTKDDTKDAVNTILCGRDLKKLTGDSLASVYIGAAELMRVKNNAANSHVSAPRPTKDFGGTINAATMNQKAREFWSKQQAGQK